MQTKESVQVIDQTSVIKALTKIVVYVKDIDTQVRFYRDVLGLKIKSDLSIDGQNDKKWVEFETGECTLVLHGNLDKRLEDRPKLAFSVSDIETAHKILSDRGAKLSPIRSPSPGVKIADGFDPEGNPFAIDSLG